MKTKSKFTVLLMFIAVLNIIVGSSSVNANDNPKVNWQYASAWAVNNPLYDVDVDLANMISEMTNGQFTMTIYPEGEMVPGYEVFDSVSARAFAAGSTAPAYQS